VVVSWFVKQTVIRTASGSDRPKSQLENGEFAKTQSAKEASLAGRYRSRF